MPDGSQDPASLQNLHDIVAPGPVPWWPPAPGWYVLAVLVLLVAGGLLIKAVRNRRNHRYRREALALLAEIRQASRRPGGLPTAIARLDELLKRVALAAWPRETVARLSGQRWLEFLRLTGRGTTFPQKSSLVLRDVAYCRRLCDELSAVQVEELFSTAADWITRHDASVAGPEDLLPESVR